MCRLPPHCGLVLTACPFAPLFHETDKTQLMKATREASTQAHGGGRELWNHKANYFPIATGPPLSPAEKGGGRQSPLQRITFLEFFLMLYLPHNQSHKKLALNLGNNISYKNYRFKTLSDLFHMLLPNLSSVQFNMCVLSV